MTRLRILTFGGVGIELDGRRFDGLLTQRKAAGVLALVAAHERGISRERLATYLWPDADAESGRNALAQLVHRLRRALGPEAVVGSTELRLDPGVASSDVGELRLAATRGDWASVVRVYRGDFLEGFVVRGSAELDQWIDGERRHFRILADNGLDKLAQAATARNDVAAASDHCRRRAELSPLSGRAALAYINALAAAGNREAAITHAGVHTKLVRAELGAEPDVAVQRRAQELRAGFAPPPALAVVARADSRDITDRPVLARLEPGEPSTRPPTRRPFVRRAAAGSVATALALVLVLTPWMRARTIRGASSESAVHGDEATTPVVAAVGLRRRSTSRFLSSGGQISADGRYFFAGTSTPDRALTRLELTTQALDTICTFDGSIGSVRISPDGKRFAVSVWLDVLPTERATFHGLSLWLVNRDGTNKREIARPDHTSGLRPIGWTPDGRGVLIVAHRDTGVTGPYLAAIDAEDGQLSTLAELGPVIGGIEAASDRRHVAYITRDRSGKGLELRVLNLSDRSAGTIALPDQEAGVLGWTRDGGSVAYQTGSGARSATLWTQPIKDGRPEGARVFAKADLPWADAVGTTSTGDFLITENDSRPVVILADFDRDHHAVTIEPLDSRATGWTYGGLFSADSRSVAYIAHHADARSPTEGLVIGSLQGGGTREIPLPTSGTIAINWSADGRSFLVAGNGSAGYVHYWVEIASGRMRPLPHPERPWMTLGRPVVLADGSLLRGVRDTTAADQWQSAENLIVRMTPSGQDRVIGRISHMVRMLPSNDGTQFLATIQDSNQKTLRLYSLVGDRVTPVRTLAPLEAPGTGRDATSMLWAPDGQSIFVAVNLQYRDAAPRTSFWRYPVDGEPPVHLFDLSDRFLLNSVRPDGRQFALLRQGSSAVALWSIEGVH